MSRVKRTTLRNGVERTGMRIRTVLKGIHSSSYVNASGVRITHYFAWRGGPALKDREEFLQPDDPRFVTVFNACHEVKKQDAGNKFYHLIDYYLNTEEFTGLSAKTQKDYKNYLALIGKKFGSMPISAFTVKNKAVTRGMFKAWRGELGKTAKRKADYVWTVLARVCSVSLDHGKIEANPCERGGRMYKADRSENIWTAEDEKEFIARAPERMRLAFTLALWTGQRQGDLLKLTWGNYDGKYLRLRQGKGKKRLAIPVGLPLRTALDAEKARKRGALILLTLAGTPWTSDGFRTSWRKACSNAGISGLTFHDIRGSAVTRLALAGASVPEIATLTGHSLADVQAILDAHYLSRDIGLADSAMKKLEKRSAKLAKSPQ